jgi:hypothetical protein
MTPTPPGKEIVPGVFLGPPTRKSSVDELIAESSSTMKTVVSTETREQEEKKVRRVVAARDLVVGSGIAGAAGFAAIPYVGLPVAVGIGIGIALTELAAYRAFLWKRSS